MNRITISESLRSQPIQLWLSNALFLSSVTLVLFHVFVSFIAIMIAFDAPITLGSCPGINGFNTVFGGLIVIAVTSFSALLYSGIKYWKRERRILYPLLTCTISGVVVALVAVSLFPGLLVRLEARTICNCEVSIKEFDRNVACQILERME